MEDVNQRKLKTDTFFETIEANVIVLIPRSNSLLTSVHRGNSTKNDFVFCSLSHG